MRDLWDVRVFQLDTTTANESLDVLIGFDGLIVWEFRGLN